MCCTPISYLNGCREVRVALQFQNILDGVVEPPGIAGGDHVPAMGHAAVFTVEGRFVYEVNLGFVANEVVRHGTDVVLDTRMIGLVRNNPALTHMGLLAAQTFSLTFASQFQGSLGRQGVLYA